MVFTLGGISRKSGSECATELMDKPIERIIQEFVPGKQVTLAHLIAHPADDLTKKMVHRALPGNAALIFRKK